MAKATKTIKQVLSHKPQHAAWFAATQMLFNQIAAFYFSVIQAHPGVLDLPAQEPLTALERLTHTTTRHPHPVMPLSDAVTSPLPAMFRRAAIHAAHGSACSFSTHLDKWRKRKEKALAQRKKFTERPPLPPRPWNRSVTLYAGQWKERTKNRILLKLWTGRSWAWIKCWITGRNLPAEWEPASAHLVRYGAQWWLHTPVEKEWAAPASIEHQVRTTPETKICAVDLNLGEQIAVCTIQTVEGTILATKFIGGSEEIAGFRKRLLGRIARNRRKIGILAKDERDNAALWRKIRHRDEDLAHLVSARVIQFAKQHEATVLAFEHLGNLRPEKGKYSRRGNSKRAFWMKGRIFRYAKYKAWNAGIITSQVNPRNTSRHCARCHGLVVRYQQGQPAEGYTSGASLVLCPARRMRGHADRNASLMIGQRLIARYGQASQEKPHTPLHAERGEKSPGVAVCQEATGKRRPSTNCARHADHNEHGTAHETEAGMAASVSSIPHQLRLFHE